MDFEQLAAATVQVVCGESNGSGFRFCRPNVIVTNHHVIEPHIAFGKDITIRSEGGPLSPVKLLAHSDKKAHDFAILEARAPKSSQQFLSALKTTSPPKRGDEIAFAGFPHGIQDLLVQRAIVSGPYRAVGFYIDGSVNGGNSGGPVVSVTDGAVIGIITQRRFLGGPELEGLTHEAEALKKHISAVTASGATIQMMGIDFGAFASLTGQSLDLLGKVITANANAGLGIFFTIAFVLKEAEKLGLI